MTTPYLGEIRLFAWNRIPKGWMACSGQTLGITQNQALFSLLGVTYGGDGVTTFKLPDLRGRVSMHWSSTDSPAVALGTSAGSEHVTLTVSNLPGHTHMLAASTGGGDSATFTDNYMATAMVTSTPPAATNFYAPPGNLVALDPGSVSPTGGNLPHENCQPSLVLNPCIAVQGVYPSRN
ncbi:MULTISPECIES: phage tail protein [Delftia]|jgi:microcystin-dependent protein|uniref:Tail fiber protein n=2 Tax=cellular organisms TaxID=131567 RepID=A0AAJ2VAN9_DELAC|nr:MULTISPECIES: tail fiber protein [Delftia]MBK0114968.1 phage tail protein [Delftia sp. S65]MBK0121166.1 phage tail protein [Delftia sp. S67]MBK0132514.1 phage tail protein [Delftia sp. S66]MDX4956520.1 tail fiber protein [Delftia acidovorans]OBY82498.1 tail collar protein [Delftia sp. JD2]